MLSRVERRYLEDIEGFEDEYGRDYAKVVRSRIRRKVERAIRDLQLIIVKDGCGREPSKEWRERANRRLLERMRRGEVRDEGRLGFELAVAKLRVLLNRDWRGRREEYMLNHFLFGELVYTISRERPWIAEYLIRKIEEGRRAGRRKVG